VVWNFQVFFQPMLATIRYQKPHWNRTTCLGETDKNRPPVLCHWWTNFTFHAFEFKNSPKFSSCSQQFETFRAPSNQSRLQDTKNRIEIGPFLWEKLIKIGRLFCIVHGRISHNAFKFKNSQKISSCNQQFETFRAPSNKCRLQDTENRIEIGPLV